ncbi:MAG TPA: DUF3040 domain-containing protein [Acidimicrobiales bacterium]|nr:DUF3040 domain-containing protein [Acidimicrobiales bacterium]
MPLNEHEERILHEIEQRFYAHDPESARRIESTTLDAYLARNSRWAAAGFVVGLIILLAAFASNWIVGVFGFVVMLASAVMLIQNLRKIGRRGIQELRQSIGSRSLPDAIEDATRRLRRRLGRED